MLYKCYTLLFMETNTKTNNLENSFLSRAVVLMAEGMEMDEAIKTAFEQEQALTIELINQTTDRSKKAVELMSHKVYTDAHVAGFRQSQNRRLNNMLDGWEHSEWSRRDLQF
jgi:hypothetical protein